MATPLSASRMVSALQAEGVRVREYGSWRTHNRNHVGAWGPVNGILIHHTVTSGSARTVEICRAGFTGLPGPLCHGVITKDGRVHLVGHGRANHAGLGDNRVLNAVIAEKRTPPPNSQNADGNARFYGFECENLGDGKDPWPPAQREAMARAAAALCRAHGWNEMSVIGHAEWTNTKIDPRGPDENATTFMTALRARVKQLLNSSPGKPPEKGFSMNAKEVFDAVTERDAIPAPTRASTYKTNPTWKMKSYFPELWDQGSRTSEKVDKLTALVEQLAAEVSELSKRVK